MQVRVVPAACVVAGPGPRVAEATARVKADVRVMGPPWELHDVQDGDDVPLFSGQESEVKALYHVMYRARSVLAGDLHVCDPQGTRYTWTRKTFQWDARPEGAALAQLT